MKFENAHTFHSEISTILYNHHTKWDTDIIESTPMLFSASPTFARLNGAELTNFVLDQIQGEIESSFTPTHPYVVIDTKVMLLMKGQYPAIPGWHCDKNPRSTNTNQPDPSKASKDGKCWTVTFSSHENGVSNTEFLVSHVTLHYDPKKVWGTINQQVEKTFYDPKAFIKARDGQIIRFDERTLHRATPAHNAGWRWFFRACRSRTPSVNKIRNQVQVYAIPDKGW